MILMAAVPIIIIVASLILSEEEMILHEGRGHRPCYILSPMNLNGQQQDLNILVIFHLLILIVIIITKTTILAIAWQ